MALANLPAYLSEPNYYRIRYQLAASMLNAESDSQPTKSDTWAQRESLVLQVTATTMGVHGTDGPVEAARSLVDEALATLKLLDEADAVRRQRFLRFRRKAPPDETRFATFLRQTILPCAQLVLAGALDVEVEPGAGLHNYELVRESLDEKLTSYRAYYNSSCYLASSPAADDWSARALSDLRISLRLAQGSERAQLASWAERDPSLTNLRNAEETGFRDAVDLAASSLPDPDSATSNAASSRQPRKRVPRPRRRPDAPA